MAITQYPSGGPVKIAGVVISSGTTSGVVGSTYAGLEFTINQPLPRAIYDLKSTTLTSANPTTVTINGNTVQLTTIYSTYTPGGVTPGIVVTTAVSSWTLRAQTQWTTGAGLYFPSSWSYIGAVAYGNNRTVMFNGNNNTTYVSTDGVNWATSNAPVYNADSLNFTTNYFVSAYSVNSNVYISTDGLNWATRPFVISTTFSANWAAYNGTYFVAIGTGGIAISTNSTTWATASVISSKINQPLRVLNNTFVVGDNSTTGGYFFMSTNGTTWTTAGPATASSYVGGEFAYYGGLYYITQYGSGGAQHYVSSNLSTWTARTTIALSSGYFSNFHASNGYIFVSTLGNQANVASSTDGIVWMTRFVTSSPNPVGPKIYGYTLASKTYWVSYQNSPGPYVSLNPAGYVPQDIGVILTGTNIDTYVS